MRRRVDCVAVYKMNAPDIKAEAGKIILKGRGLIVSVKVVDYALHSEVVCLNRAKREAVTQLYDKPDALKVAHKVAEILGFIEKKYTGKGKCFRYFEAR